MRPHALLPPHPPARPRGAILPVVLLSFVTSPAPAPAQAVGDRIQQRATRAAEEQMMREVEQLVARAVHCVFDDLACIDGSKEAGEDVVLTDKAGNVLYDEDGRPYETPEDLPEGMSQVPAQPTSSTTYDFEPGERVLFYDDYAEDNLGDFPRNLTFLRGTWELVDWQGRRLLQNTGPRGAAFKLELHEPLPEQFTVEFDVYFPHGNQQMIVATTAPEDPQGAHGSLKGNYFRVASNQQAGITGNSVAVEAVKAAPAVSEGLVPFRIMADASHVKVFVGQERVSNVPNAELPRSGTLYFENSYFADESNPMWIGPIRVAAGGRDLYDALEADGRVAVRNILFDTGEATIRSESAEILETIGAMLVEHADLELAIEGHTDDQGGYDFNMQLSADRAAAVKQYLVDEFGIDPERLRTIGLGLIQPVASNETPEGRQQNRRVELVKISL